MLFSVCCAIMRAQQNVVLYGIALTAAQQREIEALVKLFKIQIHEHCNLCCVEKSQHYKTLTPALFSKMFNESADRIRPTIKQIADFYKKVGLSSDQVDREVQYLESSLACWCDGVLKK